MTPEPLYYEAHITVEPVFEERHARFVEVCRKYRFRVATLLMQKRKDDTPERSKDDSFCTGRDVMYDDLKGRTLDLVAALVRDGFKVWRYKIEAALLDEHVNREPT